MPKQSKIVTCKCKHDFQDATYGPQKRVANLADRIGKYRCTVCLNESGDAIAPKKK